MVNLVWKFAANPENAPANFRKDIIIDVFNEAGQKVLSYKVHRCWVSEYQALELDANANVSPSSTSGSRMRDGNATHRLRSHKSQKETELANWS